MVSGGRQSSYMTNWKKNEKPYKEGNNKDKLLVGNGYYTLDSSSVGVTDKFTIQGWGVISSTQFPLRSKHPIQFRYVPVLGYEPEGDCNWQPLDSRLDLNIDETETWQKGLCSTFWLTSCYTDPFYCQINSVSGLQYVRAVRWCHSVLDPTWEPSQSKLMSTQKLQETH